MYSVFPIAYKTTSSVKDMQTAIRNSYEAIDISDLRMLSNFKSMENTGDVKVISENSLVH